AEDPLRRPERGAIAQTHALPALTLVRALTPKANLRAAYGRTFARPTFRELADIRYENVFNNEVYSGNPELELTVIDNYDLRWEWFPRAGEMMAASLFYKQLDRPIEVVNNPALG